MGDAIPRVLFVRGSKDVTDQAGRYWVDVAGGADEAGGNRAHPGHDARCTSIATVTRRRHCAYIVCDSPWGLTFALGPAASAVRTSRGSRRRWWRPRASSRRELIRGAGSSEPTA